MLDLKWRLGWKRRARMLLRQGVQALSRAGRHSRERWQRWRDRGQPGAEIWEEPRCQHCGGWHDGADMGVCPRVRRLVYHLDAAGNRRLQEVEYWPWGAWPHRRVTWPSQVPIPIGGTVQAGAA